MIPDHAATLRAFYLQTDQLLSGCEAIRRQQATAMRATFEALEGLRREREAVMAGVAADWAAAAQAYRRQHQEVFAGLRVNWEHIARSSIGTSRSRATVRTSTRRGMRCVHRRPRGFDA